MEEQTYGNNDEENPKAAEKKVVVKVFTSPICIKYYQSRNSLRKKLSMQIIVNINKM